MKAKVLSHSAISDSLWPDGLYQSPLWNSPGKNTGMDSHSLLQGIFPNQGLNPGLLHCRQILYCLSHQRSPLKAYKNLKDVLGEKKYVCKIVSIRFYNFSICLLISYMLFNVDSMDSFWLLYSILKFTYTLLNLIINDHWLLFLIFYFYKYCYKECLGTYSVWLCRHHEAAISDGRDEIWPL